MTKITKEIITFTGSNKNYPAGTREMIRIPTQWRPVLGWLVTPEEFAEMNLKVGDEGQYGPKAVS
ncbi:MAG TPA: hypothetical protein EYQ01_10145 [Nitrospira sp.]|nr:hypothetical protein [Candidatus Manganitrophaceae bacterium]